MAKRKVSNPLALAVLALLYERSMHPYEMASLMRERRKHESIKLNYGSLYTVIDALQREGLIVPGETVREGRRPERTIYNVTAAGRDEFVRWLRELLRQPVKEYTQFAAGLTFLLGLPPAEAGALLRERIALLEQNVGELRAVIDETRAMGVARVLLIETELELILREAELRWVRELVASIEDRTLDGWEAWNAIHAGKEEKPH